METITRVLASLFRDSPEYNTWMVAYLQGMWVKITGERIARVCRPLALEKSQLVIEVEDADWERALDSMKSDLLEKVRSVTGDEVRRLRFCPPTDR